MFHTRPNALGARGGYTLIQLCHFVALDSTREGWCGLSAFNKHWGHLLMSDWHEARLDDGGPFVAAFPDRLDVRAAGLSRRRMPLISFGGQGADGL